MSFAQSLKQLLLDELKIKRLLTVDEVSQIALDHGYKISNAERRLRNETSKEFLPIVKLGRDKKPIVGSKRIYFYSWKGARTALRVKQDKLEKRPKRTKQYA